MPSVMSTCGGRERGATRRRETMWRGGARRQRRTGGGGETRSSGADGFSSDDGDDGDDGDGGDAGRATDARARALARAPGSECSRRTSPPGSGGCRRRTCSTGRAPRRARRAARPSRPSGRRRRTWRPSRSRRRGAARRGFDRATTTTTTRDGDARGEVAADARRAARVSRARREVWLSRRRARLKTETAFHTTPVRVVNAIP